MDFERGFSSVALALSPWALLLAPLSSLRSVGKRICGRKENRAHPREVWIIATVPACVSPIDYRGRKECRRKPRWSMRARRADCDFRGHSG